jgi:hypothetical protein
MVAKSIVGMSEGHQQPKPDALSRHAGLKLASVGFENWKLFSA